MATTQTASYLIADEFKSVDTDSTAEKIELQKKNQYFNTTMVPVLMAAGLVLSHPIDIPTNATPDFSIASHQNQIGFISETDFEKNIINKIESFRRYPKNWDGYNGIAAPADAVNDALLFLEKLPFGVSEPRPGLSGDGEIGLFWETDEVFVDIGFVGNGKYTFYAKDEEGVEYIMDEADISNVLPETLLKLIHV